MAMTSRRPATAAMSPCEVARESVGSGWSSSRWSHAGNYGLLEEISLAQHADCLPNGFSVFSGRLLLRDGFGAHFKLRHVRDSSVRFNSLLAHVSRRLPHELQ